MAKREIPTPEELRQLLRYEPETGKLFWRERTLDMFEDGKTMSRECMAKRFATRFAGQEAFTSVSRGYFVGRVNYVLLMAHRVIWAIVHGEWPEDVIDHIDGDPSNNRIGNLRSVPFQENMRNVKRQIDNSSGVTGVSWHALTGKWRARINHGGRQVFLGLYDTVADASEARQKANAKFGYHMNHGRG